MDIRTYNGLSLSALETMRDNLLAAHAAVLTGQSYSIAGRTLTRANLSEIANELNNVCRAIDLKSGTGGKRFVVADMSNQAG